MTTRNSRKNFDDEGNHDPSKEGAVASASGSAPVPPANTGTKRKRSDDSPDPHSDQPSQVSLHLQDHDNTDREVLNSDNGSVEGFDIDNGLNNDPIDHSSIISSDLDSVSLDAGQVDPPNMPQEADECESIFNEFIQENYAPKKAVDHLAPLVSALLASTIDAWCLNVPNKEMIKSAFDQCKIPENVVAFSPIRINDIIYQRLPFKTRETDRQSRNQSTYLTRAMGPLAFMWDTLIRAEAFAIKKKQQPPALETATSLIPLRDLIACLSASMKLLGLNVSLGLQRRKSALKPHLDPKYHSLASPQNPITKFLFGDNLEQRVSDIFRVSQAARNPCHQAVRQRFRTQNQRRFFRTNRHDFRGRGQSWSSNNQRSRGAGHRCTSFNHNVNNGRNNRARNTN